MTRGRPDKREQILEAARVLLESRGAEHVGLADVAEAAGVSRQAVYLHYGDRAGLLVALVEHVDVRAGVAQMGEWVRSAPDGLEMLDRLVAMQVALYPRIRAVWEGLDLARRTDADAAAAWTDRAERRLRRMRAMAARLREEGLLAPEWSPEDAGDVLWSLTSLDVWRSLVSERGWSADAYAAHLRRVLRRVLTRDPTDVEPQPGEEQ